MCVCVVVMCAREREECALNSDDAKLFFLGWLLSERRRREKTAAKNSSETLNPNFQVLPFEEHFFDLSENKLSSLASIRRKIRERTRPSHPLSKRKEGLCVVRVLSVVVVVYVGDHRRGTIRVRARKRS